MPLQLWREYPDQYEECSRCRGTGEIDCFHCNGHGNVMGPDWYIYAGRMGRRFGLKVCRSCGGSGKQSCGRCTSGSVRKT